MYKTFNNLCFETGVILDNSHVKLITKTDLPPKIEKTKETMEKINNDGQLTKCQTCKM